MAYFVLTEGLRERLSASRPARIINTASAAHQDITLDFDDLQSAKSFGAMRHNQVAVLDDLQQPTAAPASAGCWRRAPA